MSKKQQNELNLCIPYPRVPFTTTVEYVGISQHLVVPVDVTAEALLVDNGVRENAVYMGKIEYCRDTEVVSEKAVIKFEKSGAEYYQCGVEYCTLRDLRGRSVSYLNDHIQHPVVYHGGCLKNGLMVYMLASNYAGQNLQELQFEFTNPETLTNMMEQMIRTLGYIHEQRTYHMDIKPGNICMQMIEGHQRFTLIDFGIAVKCSDSRELDERLEVSIGTPFFKSVSSHLLLACAPDFDLTGLFYTAVHLYCGHLPWKDQRQSCDLLRWKMYFTYPRRMKKYIHTAKCDAHPAVLHFMDEVMRGAAKCDHAQMLESVEVCRRSL